MRIHEQEQRLYLVSGKDVKARVVSAVAAADPQSPIAHGRKNFDAWGLPSNLSVVNHDRMTLLKNMVEPAAKTFETREGAYYSPLM